MSCNEIRDRLSEHLDGVLAPREASAVERHLAACPDCRAEMEGLRRTVAAVAALPKVKAPPGFAASVLAEIRREAPARGEEPVLPAESNVVSMASYRLWMRVVAGAAAVFLVAVGFRLLSGRERAPEGDSRGATAARHQADPDSLKKALAETGADAKRAQNGYGGTEGKPHDETGELCRDESALGAAQNSGSRTPADGAEQDAAAAPRLESPVALQHAELALQKVTVFSNNVAADARGVCEILGAAGYTYSATSDATLLVRVPAREAERLVASLSALPGGFRVESRKAVEHVVKKHADGGLARRDDGSDKRLAAKNGQKGLHADADDFQEALRRHLDESRGEIRRAKLAKQEHKEPRVARQGGERKGSAGRSPDSIAGLDAAPVGAERAGGKAIQHSEKSRHPGVPMKGANDEETARCLSEDDGAELADFAEGGTDAPERAAAAESAREAKLEDAMRRLQEQRRRANEEEAVVLVIEFTTPPSSEAKPK